MILSAAYCLASICLKRKFISVVQVPKNAFVRFIGRGHTARERSRNVPARDDHVYPDWFFPGFFLVDSAPVLGERREWTVPVSRGEVLDELWVVIVGAGE